MKSSVSLLSVITAGIELLVNPIVVPLVVKLKPVTGSMPKFLSNISSTWTHIMTMTLSSGLIAVKVYFSTSHFLFCADAISSTSSHFLQVTGCSVSTPTPPYLPTH